jgi:RecA-family ATPase
MTDAEERFNGSSEGPHPQPSLEDDTSIEKRLERGQPGLIVSASELMGADLGELEFAIPGLFPHGVNLLAGPPKTGKSLLSLNMAIAIAKGEDAFGKIPVEQGNVLYMALEDGHRRMRERLDKMDVSKLPESLEFTFDWEKFGEGGEKSDSEGLLRNVLAARQNAGQDYRLIVVDTFARLREKANANANAYYDDYAAVQDFRDVAHALDAALMVVHHTNKLGAGEDPYMRVSGSTGITANVDTVAVLERKRIEHAAELHVSGRDIEGHKLGMSLDPGDLSWTLEGDVATFQMGDTRQAIYDALKDADEPKGPKWVAGEVDHEYDNVKVEMGRMVDADQLVKVGRGQYQVKEPDLF